jgi:hypothetical protein
MATSEDPDDFDPEKLYDQFPSSAEDGVGPDEGFCRWVQINDPRWFNGDALKDPVIQAFLEAPFSVNYAQFKSSHRETEYFLHKPYDAMTGRVDGIEGRVENMPDPDGNPKISTLVINHERTLAMRITRSVVVEDGAEAAQVIHKEGDGPS